LTLLAGLENQNNEMIDLATFNMLEEAAITKRTP